MKTPVLPVPIDSMQNLLKPEPRYLVNNTDNKSFFDDYISIDGQDFVPDASVPDIQGINNL
jgi:hypothetical protein